MQRPIWRAPVRTRLILIGAVIALIAAVATVVGCNGGEDPPPRAATDLRALVTRAFAATVRSADVSLDAQLKVEGVKSLAAPIRLEASGAYVQRGAGLPKLDMDVSFGSQATGQTVQTGILSTGQRAFVKFGGEFYEQRRALVERADRRLRSQKGSGSLAALGVDPTRWLGKPADRGDDTVAGAKTDHVAGAIDVRRMLADLARAGRRSATASSATGATRPLTSAQLDRIAAAVDDARYDVYVGQRDGIVRRLSLNVGVKVPAADRVSVGGATAATFQMTIDLSKVGGRQVVDAPRSSRPLADLAKQLGGLGALELGLGGTLGLGLGTGGSGPSDGGGSGTDTTTTPGGSGTSNPEVLKRYAACLDKAKVSDTDAITRCRRLLK